LLALSALPVLASPPTDLPLSPAETRSLNTFFSNFSEVLLEPFAAQEVSDSLLIAFALGHNQRNNPQRFVAGTEEGTLRIQAPLLDETTRRFFGRAIRTHQALPARDIQFRDGWYQIFEGSGEVFFFSRIDRLEALGNDLFTAHVRVYSAGSGWTGDVHGTEADWKKADPGDIPELTERMKATLKKITEKGKSRYILIDYSPAS